MWYDYNNWSGSTPLTAPVPRLAAPPPHPLVFPQGGPPPGGWTWCARARGSGREPRHGHPSRVRIFVSRADRAPKAVLGHRVGVEGE
eukprot:scaffold4229_cov67-Phaeocystis_antarctica.AAC.6